MLGKQYELALRRGVRLVHAGVRAHEAVVRHTYQRAVDGSQQLGRLIEYRLHQPRVLVVLAGKPASALARLDLIDAPDTALGLRDDLVCQDQHVAVAEIGRGRRRHQTREVITGPDGRPHRERGDGERRQAGVRAGAVHAPARSSWRSAPRVDGAWPRRASSAAASSARSAGVSTSSVRPGISSTRCGTRAAAAAATWRARLSGPKLGPIASGGDSTSALVPVP